MRKSTLLPFYFSAFFALFFSAQGLAQDFISSWETNTPSETITIPTAPGETYLYDVDWENDGTFDDFDITTDAMHTYITPGVHTIAIRGTFPRIFFNNTGDKDKIIIINQWGSNPWVSMANAFEGCSNLVLAALDTPDLTSATNTSAMFKDALALNQDISTWDTGTITDMSEMFNGALNFDQDIGTWDVSLVTDMTNMFANTALGIENYDSLLIGWSSQILQDNVPFNAGLSEFCFATEAKDSIVNTFGWIITDGGENCSDTFTTIWQTDNQGASDDDQITIPTIGVGYNYDIDWGDGTRDENVTGDRTHTYAVPGTFTVKIRGNFPRIYFNNSGDKDKILSVENWGTTTWASMGAAFYGCTNLIVNATDTPDLSGVTSLSQMFKAAISFNSTINNWDVSTITNLSETFSQATIFNQDLSSWVTTAVTNMEATFSQSSFNQPIGNWDVSNVTTMESLFAETPFNQPLSLWTPLSVTNMSSMFASAEDFNQDISLWDVTSVTNMEGMFLNAVNFNQNISGWLVNNVTTMEGMFSSAEAFNQPIGIWNLSNVTTTSGMFTNAINFNQDIGAWNVEMVTDMSNMFNGALAFNQNLNLWDVDQVTDMSFMFASAESFNGTITGWITSGVLAMDNMFNDASVFNQDIGGWDVAMVATMEEMFTAAIAFDQDLGSWEITGVTNMDNMFTGATLSIANYDALLLGWNAQSVQNGITFNGGNSTYCAGESAREALIANSSWTIIDGGAEAIPPVPDAPTLPGINSECAVLSLTPPTATDACAGVLQATTPPTTFPIVNQGPNTVLWTYDDGNGNTVVQIQTVTITDTTDPVITTINNVTTNAVPGMCGANVNFTPPAVTDNCDVTVTSTHAPNDFFPVGETLVTYTATDTAGNSSESSFSVIISDTITPTFTGCPLNFSVDAELGSCGAVVNYTAPTAMDNCSVSILSSHNSGQFFPVGITTVTYTASDNTGNTATCSFTITVLDTVAPVFSGCPANITVNNDNGVCSAAVFYNAPIATDNCSASVTATHNSGDIFPVGITNVNYTATDAAGNTTNCTFSVTVLDIENPVISSCPIPILQNTNPGTCASLVTWTPPLQTDNCSAVMTASHNPGDLFSVGVTTVTYTATDNAGNTDTCSFTVTIIENEAPVIGNCPSNISVSNDSGVCGANVLWSPPTQTDNCGAVLTSTNAPGDFFGVGSTQVIYTATDTSGNIATCSFMITVLDAENPTFTSCPTDFTVTNDAGNCNALVFWTPPVTTDNCNVNVSASHDPGDEFPLGTTLVTYTVADPSGNSVLCNFTVTVEDTEMPTITNCPADITVGNDFGDCDATVSWVPPTATDNCISLTFTSSHTSGDMFPVGATIVTYEAIDVAGNITNCSFTVTVLDVEAPDINCPTDSTVFVDMEDYILPDYVVEGLIEISDNCTASLTDVTQVPAPGTQLSVGVYPISISIRDDALNEAICSFNLSVEAVLGKEDFILTSDLILLFPSPAATMVTIQSPQEVIVEKVTLFDVSGRTIKVENLSKTRISFDISDVASATYLVHIQTNRGTVTKQLIKE
jgi:surface protein